LQLTWIDELVDSVKTLFIALYGDQLKKPNTSVIECPFDEYFEQRVRELEKNATPPAVKNETTKTLDSHTLARDIGSGDDEEDDLSASGIFRETCMWNQCTNTALAFVSVTKPDDTDEHVPNIRPSIPPPQSTLLTPKGVPNGKLSRRAKKAASSPGPVSSGDESSRPSSQKGKAKKTMRKWDADGLATDANDDDQVLDYSRATGNEDTDAGLAQTSAVAPINDSEWGSRTSKGEFVLKDLDDEIQQILAKGSSAKPSKEPEQAGGVIGSGVGAISGLFRNIVGGKTLTKADLEKPLKGIQDHLLEKNVAMEAAVRLCESVEQSLIGVKTGNFQSEFIEGL
jgi:signal recognition particle receptor subunit alpha